MLVSHWTTTFIRVAATHAGRELPRYLNNGFGDNGKLKTGLDRLRWLSYTIKELREWPMRLVVPPTTDTPCRRPCTAEARWPTASCCLEPRVDGVTFTSSCHHQASICKGNKSCPSRCLCWVMVDGLRKFNPISPPWADPRKE
ncbi:hypothetical protein TgHK011_010070 [Trichoderma gracile]|nr:hypothetical protein TgHK011_010070 [Trichoderma gracile]